MAENPSNPPEMPDSLRAMQEEFERIGDKVKIRLQFGGKTAPKYISAGDLLWIFDIPKGAKTPMWMLGYNPYGEVIKQLPKVLAPVASYGNLKGELFILPIKANQKDLANAAKIFGDLANAASSPEIAEHLRRNWELPLKGASKLIEEVYPTGRGQTSSPQLNLAARFNIVQRGAEGSKTPFTIATNSPINRDRARLFFTISQLGPRDLQRAVGVEKPLEYVKRGQKRGAKQKAKDAAQRAAEAKETAEVLRETRNRPIKPGTSPLKGVQSKDLLALLTSAGLPPEPTEAVPPINRERAFEERRFKAQRNAELGGAEESFRGFRSATPAQKNLLESQLEDVRKRLAIQPDDSPEIQRRKRSLARQIGLAIPKAVRGGTTLAKTGEGIVKVPVEPGSQAISSKQAGSFIDLLMQSGEAIDPRRRRLGSRPPTTPEGVPVPDIAEILRLRLPSRLTAQQAAQVGAPQALARATTELASDVQSRLTLSAEEGLRSKIEETLNQVAGTVSGTEPLKGGLSKVSKKALSGVNQLSTDQYKKLVKLALETGTFGVAEDIRIEERNFIKNFLLEVRSLKTRAAGDDREARRAQKQLESIERRFGSLSGDPRSLSARAKKIFDVDMAGRAIRALTAKHAELSRSSLPRTSPLADSLAYGAGAADEGGFRSRRARGGTSENRRNIAHMIQMGVPPTMSVGALRSLAQEAVQTTTGRTPPPSAGRRIVENDGMPTRVNEPVDLSAGGRFRVNTRALSTGPANPQPPVPGSGPSFVGEFGPNPLEALRTLQPPRKFSVAELQALPSVPPVSARPTSVPPGMRRLAEPLVSWSGEPSGPTPPTPKRPKMKKAKAKPWPK